VGDPKLSESTAAQSGQLIQENAMTTFHFKPGKEQELTWFHDSPFVGEPECICSYCKEPITEEHEVPLRMWGDNSGLELRLHTYCARIVIVELAPKVLEEKPPAKKESRYKYEPAYADGQAAFTEGERRGSNPYSASGHLRRHAVQVSQRACLAWWDGWDAAWEEANPQSGAENQSAGKP